MAGKSARCRPFVPATPPPPVHPFSIRTRRNARPGNRELPLRLRQADRRARASRIAWAPDALHAEGDRTGVRAHSPGRGTFVAGRRSGDFWVSSHVRTHAQTRAEIESPRVRVPYIARFNFLPTTPLRTAAHPQYWRRYRSAFGLRPPEPRPGFRTSTTTKQVPCTRQPLTRQAPSTVTFITATIGPFGSLHLQLSPEARRWVSRPHRPFSLHRCLPDISSDPELAWGFNRLKPHANSGELTIPSRKRASNTRSTRTGGDAVFPPADPHTGTCAVLPPDDDVPRPTDRDHLTLAGETSPASTTLVGLDRSDHPPASHPRPPARATVNRRGSRGDIRRRGRATGSYLDLAPMTMHTYYWEHLRLLSDPAYAQRWATKPQAYLADGIRPIEQAADADRVLIETQERQGSGLDMMEVERLAAIVLG